MESTLPKSSKYLSTRSSCLSMRVDWLVERRAIASSSLSVIVFLVVWSAMVELERHDDRSDQC